MGGILPLWKLKREWNRFKMQLDQLQWLILGHKRKRDYDQSRARLVSVTQGDVVLTPKLAILLIWQPEGLLPSFLQELRHFAAAGYAPVVVSNAPLGPGALAQLTPLCHLVVQRPNYGYDFGGYREGVQQLRDRGIQPEHLIIKNDSIWFPLRQDCDLIDRAEASPADIYGIYENELSRRPHLQSYFYHFGPKLLRDAAFWEFWDRLWLTDNKFMVIRQCEMKLTEAFRRRGYQAAARFRATELRAALLALNDAELTEVLRYQTVVNTRAARKLGEVLVTQGQPGWRQRAEALIHDGTLSRYFLITHPHALYRALACPVLKKDHQPMYQLQRSELIRIGLDQTMTDEVRAEIRRWDA